MLRSLVGSEMCIRDRRKVAFKVPAVGLPPDRLLVGTGPECPELRIDERNQAVDVLPAHGLSLIHI